MSIYKSLKNGLPHFTSKRPIDKGVQTAITNLKKIVDGDTFEKMKTAILAQNSAEAEELNNLEGLKEAGDFLSIYKPLVTSADKARKQLAIERMLAGDNIKAIKEAADVPWGIIEVWAHEPKEAPKREKETRIKLEDGKPLKGIPKTMLTTIHDEIMSTVKEDKSDDTEEDDLSF